jgi:anaerobic ribonucleoside-triphosphate reductase activating protein
MDVNMKMNRHQNLRSRFDKATRRQADASVQNLVSLEMNRYQCLKSFADETAASLTDTYVQLAGVVKESIVDGPGFRLVVFAQGCPHRCLGCHNPETHLRLGGTICSVADLVDMYQAADLHRGITLSGGEPFLQAAPLAALAKKIKELSGDVITYTGYTYAHLKRLAEEDEAIRNLLEETDLLIDGPFILKLRSLNLPFRGSSNQTLIAFSKKGECLKQEIEDL